MKSKPKQEEKAACIYIKLPEHTRNVLLKLALQNFGEASPCVLIQATVISEHRKCIPFQGNLTRTSPAHGRELELNDL